MTPDAIAEAVLLIASQLQRASLTVTWPTPEQVAAAALEN